MNGYSRLSLVAVVWISLGTTGCESQPEGYDFILKTCREGQRPTNSSQAAFDTTMRAVKGWKANPLKHEAFFAAKLGHSDANQVKASLTCLALMSVMMDATVKAGEMDATRRQAFYDAFPRAKIREVLAAHPDYVGWMSEMRSTREGMDFTELERLRASVRPGR